MLDRDHVPERVAPSERRVFDSLGLVFVFTTTTAMQCRLGPPYTPSFCTWCHHAVQISFSEVITDSDSSQRDHNRVHGGQSASQSEHLAKERTRRLTGIESNTIIAPMVASCQPPARREYKPGRLHLTNSRSSPPYHRHHRRPPLSESGLPP
ncbi:hypothetical protein NUW54_g5917 [Trametes sanguinea]|uniref:Uncharacterized protein n=1 Tax=Trametes sanguinea TaxID=158606 RepID=A0ACC1PTT6_9APHY|nr:hypothetical protein NUW54_g5917 [Trametes sanguinea]